MPKHTPLKVRRERSLPPQRPVPKEQPFAPYQANVKLPDPTPTSQQPIPPPHAYPPHQ